MSATSTTSSFVPGKKQHLCLRVDHRIVCNVNAAHRLDHKLCACAARAAEHRIEQRRHTFLDVELKAHQKIVLPFGKLPVKSTPLTPRHTDWVCLGSLLRA